MANRYASPVMFAMEKNVTFIYGKVSFGAAGAPTLDNINSKGLCNISAGSVSFTGTTSNGSPTVTSVSSFAGLYKGMTVTGTNIPASTTISSFNAGGSTITLSQNATGVNAGLSASGGLYTVQFGTQAGVRLDTYYKLLGFQYSWDESGSQGSASVLALAPNAPSAFLVTNNIGIRTIPGTAATALTDATISFVLGSGSGTSFAVAVPNNGDVIRLGFTLCNSSSI